jgi:EAL domain-containing protein (putative c-di-GMP-specific phosphodiesterase class I)
VPLAEKAGVMYRIDLMVMRAALTCLAAARFDGEVFLNTSPRALVTPEFIPTVRRLAGEAGIAPGRLVFEITERETTHQTEQLDRFVASLKQEGFKFAVDDFGSGFASFQYVKRFPIDYLKIEGEFIGHLPTSDKDRALVRNIVALARELGIRTIAEHVESAQVLCQVAELGIDLAQGYHLGQAAPEPPLAVGAHAPGAGP